MAPSFDEREHDSPPLEDVDEAMNSTSEDRDAEIDESLDPLQNKELIRLVRTNAGAELYVTSVAQSALAQGNWGNLLAAAPDALGRLGQCFVIASDPIGALCVLEGPDLRYPSLRANLVHCSNLGRGAFRDAETRLKSVSSVAHAICEPGGLIDEIIEAVEDPDLAEIDLPQQLEKLKLISEKCVEDTKAIKIKVDAWGEYAEAIHNACEAKDDLLEKDEKELGDQVKLKDAAKHMKEAQVEATKQQTKEYRAQLGRYQKELDEAQKSNNRGVWVDLAMDTVGAAIDGAKHYLSPFSAFSSFGNAIRSATGRSAAAPAVVSDPQDPLASRDPGYGLAQSLQVIVHDLASLITYEFGPSEWHGIDFDGLAGLGEPRRNIRYFLDGFENLTKKHSNETSAITFQAFQAAQPARKVAAVVHDIVRGQAKVNQDTFGLIAQMAPGWRNEITKALTDITILIQAGYEADNKEKEKLSKSQKHASSHSAAKSRAELRFERLRNAQTDLFEAEQRLTQRLDEEMRATEEANAMELELKKLLGEKATTAEVKEVVRDCVKHLHYFCEKLNELTSFFAQLQKFIENMQDTRVNPFGQAAAVTQTYGNRVKAGEQQDGPAQLKRQKVLERKLEQLRLKALEVKGYYLVAQAMADTYTEVSAKYIMPGVTTIARLSLPDAKKMTKEERAEKVTKVGDLARQGAKDVRRLANTRKRQMIAAMTEQRGDIQEIKNLEI